MQIKLVGLDGSVHAQGNVDIIKIENKHLIKRNDRIYHFSNPVGVKIGTCEFHECEQPYIITEF